MSTLGQELLGRSFGAVNREMSQSARRAYSPDQPRDDHGRFSSDGSAADRVDSTTLTGQSRESQLMSVSGMTPKIAKMIDYQITQAENRIAGAFPHASVSLGHMDTHLATEAADRIEAFAKEFPLEASLVTRVGIEPGEEESEASALAWVNSSSTDGITLTFNADYYDSFRAPVMAVQSSMTASPDWHPRTDTAAVVDHELGHVFDAAHNWSYSRDPAGNSWANTKMAGTISRYAQDNAREAFAEAFSMRQAGMTVPGDYAHYLTDDINRALAVEPRASAASRASHTCVGYIPPEARIKPTEDAAVPNIVVDDNTGITIVPRRAYSESQPRDDHGRFTSGDAQLQDSVQMEGIMSAIEHGAGTPDNPIQVGANLNLAVALIAAGKSVQLDQPKQVSTLLNRLAEYARKVEKETGVKPKLNLCGVSVPGTNLFCAENKGIPRVQMPQFAGTPVPGSQADALPRTPGKGNEVDTTPQFLQYLADKGIGVRDTEVGAQYLRASQNELVGAKVAGMMHAASTGKLDLSSERIFVTRDNYVVDGHHRWAADVGLSYKEGTEVNVPVHMLDMDIGQALDMANQFTANIGIATKQGAAGVRVSSVSDLQRALHGRVITDVVIVPKGTADPFV